MLFKILILGASGVGKTSYLTGLSQDKNAFDYQQSETQSQVKIRFLTSAGPVTLHLMEGKGMTSSYDGIIYLMDRSRKETLKNILLQMSIYRSNVPFVVCGNKVDLDDLEMTSEDITNLIQTIEKRAQTMYFDLSLHQNNQTMFPILYLLKNLVYSRVLDLHTLNTNPKLNKIQFLK